MVRFSSLHYHANPSNISVLPLANSAGGHKLGVNGLAVDATNNLL